VYLPHLIIGLALTALLTVLNYRGVRLSATFQNWTSFGTLALFIVFVSIGVSRGSPANFPPLFTHTPLISILLVIQIVPYFMNGFESVGKAAEEASPDFRGSGFFRAIWMAIFVGTLFYASIVAAVAFVAPWRRLTGEKFMTAVAFQQAVGSRWIVNIILAAALLSLFKCFNGNFVAASRLLFALGRRGMVTSRAGAVHAQYQTPSVAVLGVGLATAACMLLGDAILVPITEVGSVACAIGWSATCAACLALPGSRPGLGEPVGHRARRGWLRTGGRNRDGADEGDPARPRPFYRLRMAGAGNLDRARRNRAPQKRYEDAGVRVPLRPSRPFFANFAVSSCS